MTLKKGTLLTEMLSFSDFEVINEKRNGAPIMRFRGPFHFADIENQNGRVYPKSVLDVSVEAYTVNKIAKKQSLGELDHPESVSINLERASHIVERLFWKDNVVIGEARLLNTPLGKIGATLINDDVVIGISSRGLGVVNERKNENTGNNVDFVSDYDIIAYDLVGTPSQPDALIDAVRENKEYIIQESKDGRIRVIEEAYDWFEEALANLPKSNINQTKLTTFSEFLQKITK